MNTSLTTSVSTAVRGNGKRCNTENLFRQFCFQLNDETIVKWRKQTAEWTPVTCLQRDRATEGCRNVAWWVMAKRDFLLKLPTSRFSMPFINEKCAHVSPSLSLSLTRNRENNFRSKSNDWKRILFKSFSVALQLTTQQVQLSVSAVFNLFSYVLSFSSAAKSFQVQRWQF